MTKTAQHTVLNLFSPDGEETALILDKKLTIGGHASNSLCLLHPSIDDYHCVIQQKDDVVVIHNLASQDKVTRIEGFSLGQGKMYLLNPGDTIHLGEYQLLLPINEIEIIDEPAIPSIPTTDDTEDTEEEENDDDEIEAELTKEQTADDISLSGLIVRDDLSPDTNEEDESEDIDEEAMSDTDQRLLQAIQEGRQPNCEASKTTFLTRLFRLEKFFNRQKQKTKAELFQRMRLPIPSPLLKIYAFVATIPLAFCCAYTFFPIMGITSVLKEFLDPFAMMLEEYFELGIETHATVTEVFYFIATAFIIDFFSQISLGATIPYFLMGIKSNDGELTKRIKAGFRSILGAITLPLIIFDLPALFGRPTFKEWLLRAPLGLEGNRLIRFLAITIVIPILMVSSFYIPFAIDPENVAGIQFERISALPPMQKEEQVEQRFYVPALNFHFAGMLPKSNYLLPSFRVIKERFSPAILISKMDQEHFATFDKLQSLDFIELIELAYANDPLFLLKYPELIQQTSGSEWSPAAVDQLARLLEESLLLTPENYHEHLLENGPFITGHLLLRRALLQKFEVGSNVNASIIINKEKQFLVINELGNTRFSNSYYLPLNSKKSSVYRLSYSLASRKLVHQIERNIIFAAEFLTNAEVNESEIDSNPLFILNLFAKTDLWSTPEVQQLVLGIYQQWDINGKEDLTKKSINSLIKTLKQLYKGKEDTFNGFYDSLSALIPPEKNSDENSGENSGEATTEAIDAASPAPTIE